MIYNFTGVQHLKTGDVAIPIIAFEDEEACQARYHHEMEYALLNKDFIGLTIIIFNNRGEIIIHDNWIRKAVQIPEIIQEEEQQTEDPEEVESEDPETEEIESEEPEIEEPESDE